MRSAGSGQPDCVLHVVPINARCAARDPFLAWYRSTPVVQVWYDAGVVGGCFWHTNDACRSAQPGIAADRFAREIVRFLKARYGALAAAECQLVRRLGSVVAWPFCINLARFLNARCAGLRRAGARGAGVVQPLVVRIARRAGVI